MKVKVTPKSYCACGQSLPWHLFSLGIGLRHICSCGAAYQEQSGVVRQELATVREVATAAAFAKVGAP